jgi:molybdopterin converting factor small subunit
MRVLIPSALHSYTGGPWAVAAGDTVAAVLDDLERQYPGIRFRMVDEQGQIRRHIRLFCDGRALQGLGEPLVHDQELCIVQALSGG